MNFPKYITKPFQSLVPYLRFLFRRPRLWWLFVNLIARRFLVSVVGIVKNDNDEILLLRHSYKSPPWDLPSGWLKKSESPLDALSREVFEETGFIIKPIKILTVGSSSSHPHLEIIIEARFVGGSFSPSAEVIDYTWISPLSSDPILDYSGRFLDNLDNPSNHYFFKW